MFTDKNLRMFDYSVTDIDESSALPSQVADRRLKAIFHTDSTFIMPDFSSLGDWEKRQAKIKMQILTAAGLIPMPDKCPLNARIFGKVEYDGFTVEKVVFESYKGFFVTGNLYRPINIKNPCPAVLNAHGHWDGGRFERSEFSDIPGRCANMAKLGFIAFSYDMIGYNDCMQIPHTFGGASNELWGMGGLAVQLWNSMRCIDFLESLEDVDASKISCTGASGGATQSFLLAAVDSRIKAVAAVNMVSANYQGGCCCENAALLRIGINNVEIAASIAPRPLFIAASDGDWTVNTPFVEYPAIHSIYSLYGKENNVEYFYQKALHNYNRKTREYVYRWLTRLFYNNDAPVAEQIVDLKQEDLRIFSRCGDAPLVSAAPDTDAPPASAASPSGIPLATPAPLDLFAQIKEARRNQFADLWSDKSNTRITANMLEAPMAVIFGRTDNGRLSWVTKESRQSYADWQTSLID